MNLDSTGNLFTERSDEIITPRRSDSKEIKIVFP